MTEPDDDPAYSNTSANWYTASQDTSTLPGATPSAPAPASPDAERSGNENPPVSSVPSSRTTSPSESVEGRAGRQGELGLRVEGRVRIVVVGATDEGCERAEQECRRCFHVVVRSCRARSG